MNKKWRIKKEYLSDDGCFARGGGIEVEENLDPANIDASQIQFALPQNGTAAVSALDVNPLSAPVKAFFAAPPADNVNILDAKNYDPNKALWNQGPTPAAQAAALAPTEAPVMQPQQEAPVAPVAKGRSGMDQMIGGYQNEAKAQGDIAKAQAQAVEQNLTDMQALQSDYQRNLAKHETQVKMAVQAIDEGQIDPERYMNSKSGMGKASIAIGLILGGLGGGLQGGRENQALKILQSHIDNDIKAQEGNLRSKENLLGQLEKQYGNKQQALQMLSSIYTQRMANRLQEAALKSGSPLAQARADQVIGQLRAQSQASAQAAAAEETINKAISSGMPMDKLSPHMDEKQRARAVPGLGLAMTSEGAKQMNTEVIPAYKGSIEGLHQLQKLANVGSKLSPEDRALAESIQSRLIGQMRLAILGPGTISEGERAVMKQVISNPTLLFSYANTPKLKSLESALHKDFAARAQQQGLTFKAPADETQFKTVNGVRYMRGPKGEAIPVK